MNDLIAFLRTRLAEDEAAAKAAASLAGPDWIRERMVTAGGPSTAISGDDGVVIADTLGRDEREVSPHIARHDPARVLREVAAKRKILEAHPHEYATAYWEECPNWGCETCHDDDGIVAHPGYCPTILALASIYSDHHDYDLETA